MKPDPAIYAHALDVLDGPGAETFVVGDSPRDDVGEMPSRIRTLILPLAEGSVRGLGLILRLVT